MQRHGSSAAVGAGFWLENLTDVFITLAFPSAESFGRTFGVIFVQRVLENMAYLFFQLDLWFKFRIWIKGKFKKDQVANPPPLPSARSFPLGPFARCTCVRDREARGAAIAVGCGCQGADRLSGHGPAQQHQPQHPRPPNRLSRSTPCDNHAERSRAACCAPPRPHSTQDARGA